MHVGLEFIPKYVRQDSDLNYGEVVTHENYNAKLNLNTTQGDYNTEVLFKLFSSTNSEDTYHIPYLDDEITDINSDITDINSELVDINSDIVDINSDIADTNAAIDALDASIDGRFDTVSTQISNLIDGTTPIAHTELADNLTGGNTAGPLRYYGTDENGSLGFKPLPPFIYADDITQVADIEGIYFVPLVNSVAESMLTPELRLKVNRESLTDYTLLSNLPQINSITLTGNKALSDLGIQPVGNYVTTTNLSTTLANYYTISAAQSWVNTQLNSYATTSSLNTTNGNVTTAQNRADSAYSLANTANTRANQGARVGVNAYVTSPQNGDIYFNVA